MKIKFYSDSPKSNDYISYEDFIKLNKSEPVLYKNKIYWDDPIYKEFSSFCFVKEYNYEIIYFIQDYYFDAKAEIIFHGEYSEPESEIIMQKQIFDVSLEFISKYGVEALKYIQQNHRYHSPSDFNRYITHEDAILISNGLF